MPTRSGLVAAVVAVLSLLVPQLGSPPAASATPLAEVCIHIDIKVYGDGVLLADGARIAVDGGFGHAGTGVTFRFQARTYPTSYPESCPLKITDQLRWEVSTWPCENKPRPAGIATQSLSWTVRLPFDCEILSSPGLLTASLTNGRGAAGGDVFIYAGAPKWTLPNAQARSLFAPAGLQGDPVNSLTGALVLSDTDLAAPALGVGLSADRTYNSDDPARGVHGQGWRTSYSDRLSIERGGAAVVLHAADGRDVRFTRVGAGPAYAVERGVARYGLARAGVGFVLTTYEQARMTFGPDGLLTGIRERNGQGVTVTQAGGRIIAVSNGRRSLRYGYDDAGLLSTVTATAPGVGPRTVRYQHAGGRLTAVTSPGGIVTRYSYDAAGRLATQTTGDAPRPQTTTEYDAAGRVVAQTDGTGHTSRWSWEAGADDNPLTGTSTMTDPVGGKWLNSYERGWLVKQTDPTGRTVRYSYDPDGNLTHVVDPLGHGARYNYDDAGRMTGTTSPSGQVVRQSVAAGNDVTGVVDQAGRPSGVRYDPRGNPVAATYGGRTASAGYDGRGLTTWTRDTGGGLTRLAYSADGDLVRSTDPAGQITSYGIDGWGRVTAVTPPRGNLRGAGDRFTTRVEYDAEGRVSRVVGPGGVTAQRTYDGRGRLTTLTDARGGATTLRYDDADRVVGVQSPGLPEARTEYDAAGRVVKRVDPGGRTQTIEYDGGGRAVAVTYGGRTWRFSYDKAGRLIRTTLPSGKSATFSRDERGLVTRVGYSDKTPAVTYTWDQLGRRTSQTDGTGRTVFGYDAFDRLTSARGPAGAVSYRWDAAGRLAARTAAGHTETYGWDAVGRLLQVRLDGKPLVSHGYDLARGTNTARHADGLTEVRRYDDRDRLTALTATRAGKTVRAVEYGYDEADQVVRTRDSHGGAASYSYDPSGRLTEVCYAACKDFIRYGYDGSGSLLWERRPGRTTAYQAGAGSETLAAYTFSAPTPLAVPTVRAFRHDPDGNLASDGSTTYTWNAAGKPDSSVTGGATTTYRHSGDGRRFSQSVGAATTRFVWDPLSPQLLASGTGPALTRYSYGEGLVAQTLAGRTAHLLTGPTGSVLTAGAVQRDYEPYGADRARGNFGLTPGYGGGLQLTGGAYLFGQREYDPRLGTFRSPDQGGSDQLYGYASGNPISRADPAGLDDILGDTAAENERLDKIRNISGAISTGALAVAVGCTLAVICAPLVPFAVGTAAIAGALSIAADTMLAIEACVAKGNCARAFINVGLLALSRRVPGLRVGRGIKGCFRSFSGNTRVLMANGTTQPIRRIGPGDAVLATDPRTGERGPRTVTRTWVHQDSMRNLDIAGARLTTTEDHPFWNASDREWQRADQLDRGDSLLAADGGSAVVRHLDDNPLPSMPAYNLTVNDLQTYFVIAGETPLLVHNSTPCNSMTSVIGDDSLLTRAAQQAGRNQDVQRDLDSMFLQLASGNMNPGIGSKALGGTDVMYARARSGARLFFRNVDGSVQIVGKADKNNESRVIARLVQLYGR